ncbi:hypothetical protein NUSPORA_01523 [Nucleospora cyclopteri]
MELIIFFYLNHVITSINNSSNTDISADLSFHDQSSTSTNYTHVPNPQVSINSDNILTDNESSNEDSNVSDYSFSSDHNNPNNSISPSQMTKYQRIKCNIVKIKTHKQFIMSRLITLQIILEELPQVQSLERTFIYWKRWACYKKLRNLRKQLKYNILLGIETSLMKYKPTIEDFISNCNLSITELTRNNMYQNVLYLQALQKLKNKISFICNLKITSVSTSLTQQARTLEDKKTAIMKLYPFFSTLIDPMVESIRSDFLKNKVSSAINTAVTETPLNPELRSQGKRKCKSSNSLLSLISTTNSFNLNSIYTRLCGIYKLKYWLLLKKMSLIKSSTQHSNQINIINKKKHALFQKFLLCQAALALLPYKPGPSQKQDEIIPNASLQELKNFLLLLKKRINITHKEMSKTIHNCFQLKSKDQTVATTEQSKKLNDYWKYLESRLSQLLMYHNTICNFILIRQENNLEQIEQPESLSCLFFKNEEKSMLFHSLYNWLDMTNQMLEGNIYDTYIETNIHLSELIEKLINHIVNKTEKLSALDPLDCKSTKSSSCD